LAQAQVILSQALTSIPLCLLIPELAL